MFWQANLYHGDPVDGQSMPFASLRPIDVVEFAIVEQREGFRLVKWSCIGRPLNYETRTTPNETVHVIDMPAKKVFVFEGTGEVVTLPIWGTGIFAPISQDEPDEPPVEENISG